MLDTMRHEIHLIRLQLYSIERWLNELTMPPRETSSSVRVARHRLDRHERNVLALQTMLDNLAELRQALGCIFVNRETFGFHIDPAVADQIILDERKLIEQFLTSKDPILTIKSQTLNGAAH